MSAVLSECRKYRYALHRNVDNGRPLFPRLILFIMLNPSTADEEQDDPTIRRCIGFAQRELCTDLVVVNLFAARATDPKQLSSFQDPIGPENDHWITQLVKSTRYRNGLVVAAWGTLAFARKRAAIVTNMVGPMVCLKKSQRGEPCHPLYLPANSPLTAFP